jgi:hypothetical protein
MFSKDILLFSLRIARGRPRGRLLDAMLESTSATKDDLPAFVEWAQTLMNRARPLLREAAPLFIVLCR